MKTVNVDIDNNLNILSYDILIGSGILEDNLSDILNYNKILIVSDDNIPKDYIDTIYKISKNKALIYIIKNGEDSKNIKNYESILDFMLNNNFTRNSLVIAFGGGVVGDLSAFVASTYMRGVDFINIPTTFLSMVDSSSGGKTAINYKNVKNVFGTFYNPKKVIIDINLLKSLNIREFNSGIIESVKMAMTFDAKYYITLAKYIKKVLGDKNNIENDKYINIYNDILVDLIKRSVEIKKDVIEKDAKEKDLRRVLNFGHTLGHAIEEACKEKVLHGECVARGIYLITDGKIRDEFSEIMKNLNIDIKCDFDINKAKANLHHDKKGISDEKVAIIKVNEIGSFDIEDVGIESLEDKLELIKL